MKRHVKKFHEESKYKCEFAWKVVKSFNKPALRQLTEAVYINNANEGELMNMKSEYFKNNVKGIKLNNNEKVVCRDCARTFSMKNDLQVHFEDVHERKLCEACPYIGFVRRDSIYHMKTMHNIIKS